MIARVCILFILLVSLSGSLQADTAKGQVLSVSGAATLVTAQGHSEPITRATLIPPGSKIRTGSNARVIVEWVPGAFSVVFPNSNVTVSALAYSKPAGEEPTREVAIGLLKGSIFSHLAHHDGTSDFHIKTPQGVAAARGTDWIVSYAGGVVKVSVLADTVKITLPSGTVVVVPTLFNCDMGDPAAVWMQDQNLQDFLKELEAAGLKVALQDFNPANPNVHGVIASGYLITYTPDSGGGFEFFIPKRNADPDINLLPHVPPGETPIPSSEFPKVPPVSP